MVGYLVCDSCNDVGVMEDIFGNIYDVKCFVFGEVVGLFYDVWYLIYDCLILGGNFGLVVFLIDGGEVVGLYFGG